MLTSSLPAGAQSLVVSANGIRLHCVEAGKGPLVLLIHGFPESWYSWRHQLPALAAAGYRAVAIDVRGYGRSARPAAIDDASGDAPPPGPDGTMATIPAGAHMKDRFRTPKALPDWLTEDDVDFYTGEFERTGFSGGLNRYRNVDRDWQDLAAWRGAHIDVPALFIGGDRDGPTVLGAAAIARFGETLPQLHRSIILEGCGHWTQQERPAQVNAALIEFLATLP